MDQDQPHGHQDDVGQEDPNSSVLYLDSYIVILYLLVFLFLLGMVGYGLCCGIPAFLSKHCRCTSTRCWGVPCVRVRFNAAAYREERATLQRVRDIRRIQRQQYMHALQMAAFQQQEVGVEAFNATPNNIAILNAGQRARAAGSITPAERFELRRLAFIHAQGGHVAAAGGGRQQTPDFADRAAMWAAFHQMNSMGLLIVPRDVMRGQEEEVPFRETLSTEERKAALGEMLEFAPYQGAPKPQDEEHGCPKDEACMENVDGSRAEADVVEKGEIANSENLTVEDAEGTSAESIEPRSFALPAHEVPDTAETTCAICLDDFEAGDLLNSQTKCSHRFHQDCLIMWLEHHDMCPICRRVMVTDSDWREAHGRGANSA